jgi:cytochrome c biogenesis protein CcdA
MNEFVLQGLGLFGAGVLTSLTPCVYPMIPISVGFLGAKDKEDRSYLRVLLFILGQVLAFSSLGLLAVYLGEVMGFSSELPEVQIATGVMLLVFAYFSYKGAMPTFLNKWNNLNFFNKNDQFTNNIFASGMKAFFIGVISAFVASPCTSPILGGVLTQIAQSGSLLTGGALMFSYASGLSLLFLFIGIGLVRAKSLPKSGKWLNIVHRLSTFLLMIGGLYFLLKGVRIL